MSRPVRASVVIPAFDAATTIDAQLGALAAQSFDGEWEVIVADNGSTDDTVARTHRWRDRLPGLRVVDASRRRGPSAARNIAAESARGEVLLFCDADDAAAPDWVRALAASLETADAASGSRRYDQLNRARLGPADWLEPTFTKQPLTHLAAASSHNLGARAEVFAALGGFDESMAAGEDIDFCWRLQLSGYRFVGAPAAVMQIRRREGLLSTYRQAYAYGRADRVLEVKFAGIAVPSDDGPSDVPTPSDQRERSSPIGRLKERGLRLPDPVFALDRLGRRLGRRFGRIDPSIRPFVPPTSARS